MGHSAHATHQHPPVTTTRPARRMAPSATHTGRHARRGGSMARADGSHDVRRGQPRGGIAANRDAREAMTGADFSHNPLHVVVGRRARRRRRRRRPPRGDGPGRRSNGRSVRIEAQRPQRLRFHGGLLLYLACCRCCLPGAARRHELGRDGTERESAARIRLCARRARRGRRPGRGYIFRVPPLEDGLHSIFAWRRGVEFVVKRGGGVVALADKRPVLVDARRLARALATRP